MWRPYQRLSDTHSPPRRWTYTPIVSPKFRRGQVKLWQIHSTSRRRKVRSGHEMRKRTKNGRFFEIGTQMVPKIGFRRKKKTAETVMYQRFQRFCLWSEWRDLNPWPLGPEPSAIPNFATPRCDFQLCHYKWYCTKNQAFFERNQKATEIFLISWEIFCSWSWQTRKNAL